MNIKGTVALSVLLGSLSPRAHASSNAEVLQTLNQWIIDHGLSVSGYEQGHEVIIDRKSADICRIHLRSKPYSQTTSAPEIYSKIFDAKKFEVRTSTFSLPSNPQSSDCSLATSMSAFEATIDVRCQWRECETQGCTELTSRVKLTWKKWTDGTESNTFEVNGMSCRVEYAWPEVPS